MIIIQSASILFCQDNIEIAGRVISESGVPLPYASVIAISSGDLCKDKSYAITDDGGLYTAQVKKCQQILLYTNSLGYRTDTILIETTEEYNYRADFTLAESALLLDSIVIKGREPVQVTGDTISYQVADFVNGNEKKLKDVLKKLPGIDVKSDGTVMVGGQRVKKLLVENELFFTGGTQLGLDNIPADVIGGIDIISNYTGDDLLQSFLSATETVINVDLKENEKNSFQFGNVKAQLGNEDYLLHANAYSYAKDVTLNYIGDINNIGSSPITIMEFMDLNGGLESMSQNSEAFFQNMNSPLLSDFFKSNFESKQSRLNIGDFYIKSIPRSKVKLTLTDYHTQPIYRDELDVEYVVDQLVISSEERSEIERNNNANQNLKIKYDYSLSPTQRLALNGNVDLLDANRFQSIEFKRDNNRSTQDTDREQDKLGVFSDLSWTNVLNRKNAFKISVNYNRMHQSDESHYVASSPELYHQSLIDIDPNLRALTPMSTLEDERWQAQYEHFHKASSNVLLTGSLVLQENNSDFELDIVDLLPSALDSMTLDRQQFEDRLHRKTSTISSRLNLKYTQQKSELKLRLEPTYNRVSTSSAKYETDIHAFQMLGSATYYRKINPTKSIFIIYNRRLSTPSLDRLSRSFQLSNINTLTQGFKNTELPVQNNWSLIYDNKGFKKRRDFNIGFQYTYSPNFIVQNINQFRLYDRVVEFSLMPKRSFGVNTFFKRRFLVWSIGFRAESQLEYYDQRRLTEEINRKDIKIESSVSFTYAPTAYLYYESNIGLMSTTEIANVDRYTIRNYYSKNMINLTFRQLEAFVQMDSYWYHPQDASIVNRVNCNIGIQHAIGTSRWNVGLEVTNLFNQQVLLTQNFSTIVYSQSRQFLLPRIVTATVDYQF